ncbi:MAG: TonB-dependent receptor [Acidobacteriota bacterium]
MFHLESHSECLGQCLRQPAVLLCLLVFWLAGGVSAQESTPESLESPEAAESAEDQSSEPSEEEAKPPAEIPVALDEINVTAGYSLSRDEPVSTVALSAVEILELPHFGDDVFRALPLLPGITGNDVSAQFNIRGGLFRENLQRIDGQEIYEPYHLKDFQGVFSIIDPDTLGGIDIINGGFPSQYGDRMTGVLDMTTRRPTQRNLDLGISLSSASAKMGGLLPNDKGSWMGSLRRGYLDIVLGIVGDDDEEESEGNGPAYWDLFGKLDYQLTDSQTLTFNVLAADDSLDQKSTEIEDGFPEREELDTGYGNAYLWGRHLATVNPSLFVESAVSLGRVDRDRTVSEEGFNYEFAIQDVRQMDVLSLKQDWNWQLSDRHYLKWGFEGRSYDVEYDYFNTRLFLDDIGTPAGAAGSGITQFKESFSDEQYGLYLADRIRVSDPFTVEIGARWDQQGLTDEDQFSPRLNAVYNLGNAGVLRASWGYFHQSQRPNELQVEDGETRFFPAERAEHRLIGWERSFRLGQRDYNLRVDAYQREITDPRPRYENLFDAFSPNPEATSDRILLAPESASAQGLEIFLSRRSGSKFSWWVGYALSEVTDLIGGRDVPRSIDQTHALTIDLNWRPGPKWNFNFAWLYHTGWPTTGISGTTETAPDGTVSIVPVVGPLYGENLDDYHRLDMRASREFSLSSGKTLELFVDIQNVYNRENQAGFQVDDRSFALLDNGEVEYIPNEETFLGIVPSFGLRWRF